MICRGLQSAAPATKSEPEAKLGLHFVRACAIEMHMAILSENLQEKCRAPRSGQPRRADFVRAWAGEMHMDMAQSHFYARIYSKNAWSNPGLNSYRKKTSVWTYCLGKSGLQLKCLK